MLAWAQSAVQPGHAVRPKFVVASIKPCRGGSSAPERKGGGGGGEFSPGTLRVDCSTVMDLIEGAYVLFANGHVNPRSRAGVEGGPAWIHSDRYQIDAKADGAKGQGMMRGPMLQTLLEDRFKLRLHHETREVPAYALTVAKGGLKLRPFQAGTCIPRDFARFFEQFPPQPFPELPPGQKYCGGGVAVKGAIATLDATAMSIDDFFKYSLPALDRPVVNKTGITGLFDFHLEYASDEPRGAGATSPEVAGPSVFDALERQLGLKPELAKARGDFLLIDHVERPSAN
ncbi:MAG: TIGR03435 family protein [Candidatus Sulfopaludibacter sp.]|nr:TIGR03435 family protein [Candidatus Sulfopaludibacter sp.]